MYESQTKKVYEHLKTHGSITSMEAIRKYSITRLAVCISRLKSRGCEINTEIIRNKNDDGRTIMYAKYSMRGEEDYE